jgi:AcrR family transcriptional regulator
MGRTLTITNEQILKAAQAVFLEQGTTATAVDVAKRAGISSASIFKRYPTKEALLMAAMAPSPGDRMWTPELEVAIGHGDPCADLILIARRIAAYLEKLLPRMMLLRSVRLESNPTNSMPEPPRIEHDFAALTAYFGREMALGRIVRGDPTIPALALIHATGGFAMSQAFSPAVTSFDATRFLEDFVGILWRGLEPSGEGR